MSKSISSAFSKAVQEDGIFYATTSFLVAFAIVLSFYTFVVWLVNNVVLFGVFEVSKMLTLTQCFLVGITGWILLHLFQRIRG